jgi:hypothetical protein
VYAPNQLAGKLDPPFSQLLSHPGPYSLHYHKSAARGPPG